MSRQKKKKDLERKNLSESLQTDHRLISPKGNSIWRNRPQILMKQG